MFLCSSYGNKMDVFFFFAWQMRQNPNPNHKDWFPIIKSHLHGTGSLTPPAH